MKLCTTIGDFHPYCETWKEQVEAMEGSGFRYLDFNFYFDNYPGSILRSDNWMDYVKEAKESADRLGMTFVQAHAPRHNYDPLDVSREQEAEMEAIRRAIEACGYLGIKNLVLHSCKMETLRYPGDKERYFEVNRDFFRKFVSAMEKYNVNILIENSSEGLMKGKYFFMTAAEMKEFIVFFGHSLLHACWDIGHANMRGVNQYEELMTLGRDLYAVHIQDNFGLDDIHLAPFSGTVNMDAVMTALVELGHLEYFTFEAHNMISPYLPDAVFPRLSSPNFIPDKILNPSKELRQSAEKLLYHIGEYILKAYDCLEV